MKFLGLVDNRLVGFPDLWFHPCICQTWQLKQQVENQFDLSPHEGSIKLWDMSGKLDCQTGSLSSPLGSIILYKMIICLLSNGFEETIWICLLLQHTRIVRIDKNHLCNLNLCLFHCSVMFHDNQLPLHQTIHNF